jgi:hypothetical protein
MRPAMAPTPWRAAPAQGRGGSLARELLLWRLVGASVWAVTLFVGAHAAAVGVMRLSVLSAIRDLFSLGSIALLSVLCGLHVACLLAHRWERARGRGRTQASCRCMRARRAGGSAMAGPVLGLARGSHAAHPP